MLRFFRQYVMNQWTLVIGGCILMVVFLLPSACLNSAQRDMTVGHLNGSTIKSSDLSAAESEVRVCSAVFPLLGVRAILTPGNMDVREFTPLQWVLMLKDAQAQGLSASEAEVTDLLRGLGVNEERLNVIANSLRTSKKYVIDSLRKRATIQRYMAASSGLREVSAADWAGMLLTAAQARMMRRGDLELGLLDMSTGSVRMSEPITESFLQDTFATVRVSMVPVTPKAYMDKVEEPSEESMKKLFEEYKDKLIGQSEPYGFGYRYPDRVKVEYLTIDRDKVAATVKVDEAEALKYYDENPSRYAPRAENENAPPLPPPAYLTVRDAVYKDLKSQKTDDLSLEIARYARGLMIDDARGQPMDGGYRDIPAEWKPIALTDVAQKVQQKYGVLPSVVREDSVWMDSDALAALPGIGGTLISEADQIVRFADYAMSVREIADESGDYAFLRFQTRLPSETMRDYPGNLYLFRVIDAQRSHVPQSMDEVATQVRYDARRIEAYKLIESERASWAARMSDQAIDEVATAAQATVVTPAPFPRRVPERSLQPPMVRDVGRNAGFVDAVFKVAQDLAAKGPVATAPQADRTLSVLVPEKLTLFLVRIDGYDPMTRKDFEKRATQADTPFVLKQLLLDRTADGAGDPFSEESLATRVGYIRSGEKSKADN
ncbi:MAG: hypothetical protein GC164_09580 [Phycisphaera sp.]|nr:hypothetical protein [Phycisphaera sp.]